MKIFSTLLGLLAAAVFFFVSNLLYTQNTTLLESGTQTEGTVLSFASKTNKNKLYYYPIVEFSLEDGSAQTGQLGIGSTKPAYAIGASIPIIFNPDNPSEVTLNNKLYLYGVPALLFTLASLILVGSLVHLKKSFS